jgi:hypothetical protein
MHLIIISSKILDEETRMLHHLIFQRNKKNPKDSVGIYSLLSSLALLFQAVYFVKK